MNNALPPPPPPAIRGAEPVPSNSSPNHRISAALKYGNTEYSRKCVIMKLYTVLYMEIKQTKQIFSTSLMDGVASRKRKNSLCIYNVSYQGLTPFRRVGAGGGGGGC